MGTYRPADRGAEQISSASITVCGDRLRERLTAEECTIRGVHIWLHVEQASGCHRSDGELSHIYDTISNQPMNYTPSALFIAKSERKHSHERKV